MNGTGAEPGHEPDAAAWAPVDACTLPTPEQPLREAEFDALFAANLRSCERPEPTSLRLSLDDGPGIEAATRELLARESSCCSFFDFDLVRAGDLLVLDVRVPAARVEVLDGLARRAHAAHSGDGSGVGSGVGSGAGPGAVA